MHLEMPPTRTFRDSVAYLQVHLLLQQVQRIQKNQMVPNGGVKEKQNG